ncbi:MAG TPA: M1 family metallopeptidase [Pyrinomonadaceae bacterium]
MIRSKSFLTLLWFLVLFCLSTLADAQSAPRNFTRAQTYDAEHYVIRVTFDRPAQKVIGDTTIRLKPLKDNFSVAEFDAVGITFGTISLEPDAIALKFRTQGNKVLVTLNRPYKAGEAVTLRFRHSSVPKKGVYFIDEEIENGRVVHSAQIWTQGEPDEARHWFPSFDFPSDKATTEQFITANAGETVVGNGEFVEEVKNPDQTVTHHFRMSDPMPTYLVSFVVGKYVRVSDKYRDIPLGFFVYPGAEATALKAFGDTKEMMRVFESLTGVEYPYKKYDQTIVSGFTFGGMENMTATTMADTEIFAVNNPLFTASVGDLVSHELAHSWFGNLVTCRNWAELWLNEGFATFMEAAYREKAYGRRNYMTKILRDAELFIIDDAVNKKRNGLFNQNADDVGALFDRPATTYSKGGAVLHTLREEIGDEVFWKAVNTYLNRHRFGSVESSDLLNVMEETSGRDLEWFFDQWVYMAGHPKLDVKQVWIPASNTLRLTVAQTQKPDRITPAVFRLPMEVEFTTPSGEKTTEKLNITKRLETFSVKLPAKPETIQFDPRDKIPVKTVKIAP